MNSEVILSQIRVFKNLFNKYCRGLRDLEKAKASGVPYQLIRINSFNIGSKDKPLEIQSSDLLKMLTTLKPYLIKIITNESINTLELAITFKNTQYDESDKINFNGILIIEEVISKLEKYDEETEVEKTDALLIINSVDSSMVQYLDHLHPEIKKSSYKLFIDGHYQPAILESIKAINQYLRDKTGSSLDGDSLYNEVFSPKKAVLSFSGRSDVSGDSTLNNEQLGFMDMLKGFSKGVRNVLAHNPAKPEDPQKAFEYLVMASLFCRRIDDTHKVSP